MRQGYRSRTLAAMALLSLVPACSNDPYRTGESAEPTYFRAFSTEPTKLDPTSAYYVHEGRLIDQIYEPPFTYHYLKRPYRVIPLTAKKVPVPSYFDQRGEPIPDPEKSTNKVARVEYTVSIKPGIMYQNHPCFALRDDGTPRYRGVTEDEIKDYSYPSEFPHQATRELRAEDYALQVRRLADPRLESPILSAMAAYILGLEELNAAYKDVLEKERARRRAAGEETDEKKNPIRLDYMAPDFPGVEIINKHAYKVVLKKKYPQIIYWMCMHFFGPVPREAVEFFSEPAVTAMGFSINRCPIGTGPYYMHTFRPNEKIVLQKNPNYHDDFYPTEGAPGDEQAGLLVDAGQRIPFIHKQVIVFEKESLPTWNKFLQGYYDASGIDDDVFDQAVDVRAGEDPDLSSTMKEHGISLITDIDTTLWYTAFNMIDPLVGGHAEDKRKLRQAISIALDYNEYLDIFANGRGVLAQGPLPPGIFGHRSGPEGANPFVDTWDVIRARHARRPIEDARKLLAEAGYPEGRDPEGRPLTIFYDHSQSGNPAFRAYYLWQRDHLKTLGINFQERPTDLSQYRKKRLQGNWQVLTGGWLADYPDPENFLFLFYGPNGKKEHGGPNVNNYRNDEFDRLFRRMESMQNSPERQEIIDKMMKVIQEDAPSVWQYYPVSYSLYHRWYKNVKPHQMCYNIMKYRRIDAGMRARLQRKWNRPRYWPVLLVIVIIVLGALPGILHVYRSQRRTRAC
ncbi:ABC transporter substrate-binding protein [Verrucomicrobiota bacterium]